MTGKCVVCLNNEELSEEHIIPESVGGLLTINDVCRKCNQRFAKNIDEPFSKSDFISLYRMSANIPGKRGVVPNVFTRGGTLPDGREVHLNDKLEPRLIPSLSRTELPTGGVKIAAQLDASNMDDVRDILRKAIFRSIRSIEPELSVDDANIKTNKYVETVLASGKTSKTQEEIKYELILELDVLALEYTKVAYEMAVWKFGNDYVDNSKTAQSLRSHLLALTVPSSVRVVMDEPFPGVANHKNSHYVILCEGRAWIRIAGIWGVVDFEEHDQRFLIPTKQSVVVEFVPATAD